MSAGRRCVYPRVAATSRRFASEPPGMSRVTSSLAGRWIFRFRLRSSSPTNGFRAGAWRRCRRPTIHPNNSLRARRLFATKPEHSLATHSAETLWNSRNGEHMSGRDARFWPRETAPSNSPFFPDIAPLDDGTDKTLSRIYAESICAPAAVEAFLEYARQEATALLVSQRHVLKALAEALEARGSLTGPDHRHHHRQGRSKSSSSSGTGPPRGYA